MVVVLGGGVITVLHYRPTTALAIRGESKVPTRTEEAKQKSSVCQWEFILFLAFYSQPVHMPLYNFAVGGEQKQGLGETA